MSIQQSLNTALTTSAALYTQSAGYKERQIQKLGKFAEAKEEEFASWKKQAASNIKRAQTAYSKAKNELDELTFKRNLYRNLYGGAR